METEKLLSACHTPYPPPPHSRVILLKCQRLLLRRSVVSSSSAAPWTVAHQAPPSMGFPGQEYRSGLAFLSPGDLPDPRIELASPALAGRFFTTEPPREAPNVSSAEVQSPGLKHQHRWQCSGAPDTTQHSPVESPTYPRLSSLFILCLFLAEPP